MAMTNSKPHTHESFKMTVLHQALVVVSLVIGLGIGTVSAATDEARPAKAHSDGVVATVADSAITTKVKARLLSASSLNKSDISVTTTNGVVTLEGFASNADAKIFAGKDASKVEGVKSVENNLKLAASSTTTTKTHEVVAKTERVMSDSWITTKVKSEIYADSVSKGFKVGVKTLHGVVILKGILPNQDGIDHVKDIAGKVEGVKSVNVSALTITSK
ncbi:BON domain-containing protein [Uliginosibacterium gangwonense]|uniref:BON domain-containing protein n=1 Tax=Uliginosibacterium gangwonense TaxID=392736 RepID=UPI000476AFCD|nr:BON domain-containing protein [Uliginosibacterium gangwonense]